MVSRTAYTQLRYSVFMLLAVTADVDLIPALFLAIMTSLWDAQKRWL